MSEVENVGGVNRYFCSTIEDTKALLDSQEILIDGTTQEPEKARLLSNVWMVKSLLGEIQVYGNRMEAKLYDQSTYETLKKDYKKLLTKKDKLEKELKTK